ncbi:hypothetical protein HPB50_000267 [Hyalomma asiaticum]|uniref:Uncharacterized protein n=1 Tax=Hyalomma asiaticum TaxID=266040 RepID=A0ACB7S4M8_HYAAI|nr:hypothetical protein HPB50_000267 [Hyalomma asiaticum]
MSQARARWQSRRVGCHRRSSSNHHQHTRTVDQGEPSRLVLRSPSPLAPSAKRRGNSSNSGYSHRLLARRSIHTAGAATARRLQQTRRQRKETSRRPLTSPASM